jgi:cytochrome b561
LIAIVLHWIVAIGFIGSYATVYYRHWFTEAKTPENWAALQLHLSFGVTIAVFVVLRVVWKSMNVQPKDVPGTPVEHLAAHAVHWALYGFMIIMPITGYLGTGTATEYFFQFDIPKFADTAAFRVVFKGWMGLTFEAFEKPIDFIHKKSGAYVVWVLVGIHAAAALYHHFVRKDIALIRMLSPITNR